MKIYSDTYFEIKFRFATIISIPCAFCGVYFVNIILVDLFKKNGEYKMNVNLKFKESKLEGITPQEYN